MQLQFLSMSNTFLFLAARRVVISILFRKYKHGDKIKRHQICLHHLLFSYLSFLDAVRELCIFITTGWKKKC